MASPAVANPVLRPAVPNDAKQALVDFALDISAGELHDDLSRDATRVKAAVTSLARIVFELGVLLEVA